ncbi:MAG TPA: lytic polysaccharide monooxygenase [Planosporangium sp.]|nr:lytic polysaccharide monooxygenase [Planosporangium sp.]
MYAAAAVLAAGVGALVVPSGASAHGAMMKPGSRTYLCWQDGLSPQGNIVPNNPACAAAVAQSGANSLYNWFGVLRSDGAGRTRGFIPDGQLCSGGNANYSGYNLARDDWPLTHLTAGANFNWWYSNWAAHPGTFSMYVTKSSWSPTRLLGWNDLEDAPFLQVTNPAQSGAVGTNDGHYYWSGNLPSGKSGRHIIYSVWARSDSQETFYGCSDVTFDGGNGQVTGVGPGGGPGPSPGPTPTPTSTPTNPPPGGGSGCGASYSVTNSWADGFQADVTVRNSGSSAINGWTVRWTFPGSQTVTQLWNGSYTQSGSQVTTKNASYNGSVAANGTTSFGFTGGGAASASVNNLTCTSP